jgi:hypothetical protein
LLKSLEKDPTRRYQSAAHLQQDIGYWLKGMPVSARADSSIYLLRKIITRHYYTSAVVALLLVILFGFSCFVYQLYGKLRDNNIKLISSNKSLVEQAMQLSSLALNVSFSDFLRAFQAEPGKSQYPPQYFVRYFTGQRREMKAATFLLDKRPLAEKVTEFRQELATNEPLFTEFIIAEHYIKDGNRGEALKAYQKCLSYDLHLDKNRWLATQVKSRLYELTNEDTLEKTSSKVED